MPLESLLTLVETLRNRAETHRDALQSSEALTRYALIDPLLRELGWDTADPAMVAPEYRVPNNQIADYVLFNDNQPVIVVESKKLDEPLESGRALDQGILYCAHTGSRYFLLTDGRRWQIYESGSTVPVVTFDLMEQSPAEFCLKALALWRPSVQADSVVGGSEPIIIESTEEQDPPSATNRDNVQNVITPPAGDWMPLTGIDPINYGGGDIPPRMLLPNGVEVSLDAWNGLTIEAVRWLNGEGLLEMAHCPIRASSRATTRYLVHTQPAHRSGNPFSSPRNIGSGLHLELDYTVPNLIKNTIAIIRHVGQDPAQFKVRFD